MKRILLSIAALLAFFCLPVIADEKDDFTEGAVTVVTAVKVLPGQSDAYTKYLRNNWKPMLEAQKKEGIVLDYSVQATTARTPNDPDLYLVVTYPNMASFDGLSDKVEPIALKVTGMDRDQANKGRVDREAMRTILGSEMMREMVLK